MSYSTLPAETREIAERVLTRKQLDVFKLWCAGVSATRIALMLGVSETRVRYIIKRCVQKIDIEKTRRAA